MKKEKKVLKAGRKTSFGVLAACIFVMVSAVLQGMKVDREEREALEKEQAEKAEDEEAE